MEKNNSHSQSEYNCNNKHILYKSQLLLFLLLHIRTYRYSENAKNAMKIFKDRPMSPESLVVYWTEYVLRHHGAPHLKSCALNLKWYQYYLLDVIAFTLACISFVVLVIYNIFKYAACVVCTKISNHLRNVKVKRE